MPFVWLATYGSREVNMFWQLLPGPVVGGQACERKIGRTWPNLEPSERANIMREYDSKQFPSWTTDSTLEMPQKISVFMRYGSDGQISRLGKENLVGSRFAACMWTSTKAVICNRHEKHAKYLMPPPSLVKKRKFWWRSPALSRGACCVVLVTDKSQSRIFEQWHNGREVIDLAIVGTFTLSFGRLDTLRMCFLRSMRTVLWDINREMKGWGLFFCHMTVTVKTIFLMNENGRNT